MDWAVSTSMTLDDHVSATFRRMESGTRSFGDAAEKSFRRASSSSSRFGDIVKGVMAADIIQNAASAMKNFAMESVTVTKEAEALSVAYKSVFAQDAASQMQFVRMESERLGLAFKESSESYMMIAAAAKGTAISNETVQETFRGVSEAAAALQLDGEKVGGALTAISQMISKGKVSAEELRGQLGERLPGAFQIAARAMNMSTGELDKMMSSGKLMAEDFLPNFAQQLRVEFGGAALEAANSFGAISNKFDNSMRDMKISLGKLVLPALTSLMIAIRPVIDAIALWATQNRELISIKITEFIDGATKAAKILWPVIYNVSIVLGTLFHWIYVMRGPLTALSIAFVVFRTVMTTMSILSTVITAITILQGKMILAGGATAFFNAVLYANPIVWIVGLIALLIGSLIALVIYWDEVSAAVNGAFTWFDNLGPVLKTIIGLMFPMIGAAYLLWKYWDSIVGAVKGFIGIQDEVKSVTPDVVGAGMSIPGIGGGEGGMSIPGLGGGGGMQMPEIPSQAQITAPTPESQTQKMKLEFYGRIDVFGLPKESKFTRTGGNAPDIDVSLLGENK